MATARRTPAAARGPATSSGYRGAAGFAMMNQEQKNQEARKEAQELNSGMPFRFFCPVGATREIIVVDDKPDFFRYEHNLKDKRTGRFSIFCACTNETSNCPVCKSTDRPSYFGMYLTVIDLTPYTNKDNIEVPWSKKLLVVKPAQQKKFMRFYEREGSLRGMLLAMTRDGDKDAGIGNDIELVETLSEDDLLQYEDQYADKKNKVHDVIGHEAFDYDDLFPLPTDEQLRAIAGGASAEPGSRESDREALRTPSRGGSRGRATDDWEEPAAAAPARRLAVRPRAAEPEEEEPADPPPRRAPPGRAAAPPARTPVRRGAPAAAEEDEGPYEEEPADPPPRRALPTSRAATAPTRRAATAPTRRAAPEQEDEAPQRRAPPRRAAAAEPEEEYEEPAPARGASSMADRRRALRR